MAENTENLVLEHLRAIRAELTTSSKRMSEVTQRLSGIEAGIASIKADIAHHYSDIALLHSRGDGLLERIERIEKRLGLIET